MPYFYVRSFRYSASYRQWRPSWFSNVPRWRASGMIALKPPPASRPLSSFDAHARWQPVTQSARSWQSCGKIEDGEQSGAHNIWAPGTVYYLSGPLGIFCLYVILAISYLRARTIETSSLSTDSSWPLLEQIEIFSAILTVYFNCKYFP